MYNLPSFYYKSNVYETNNFIFISTDNDKVWYFRGLGTT